LALQTISISTQFWYSYSNAIPPAESQLPNAALGFCTCMNLLCGVMDDEVVDLNL
jgi:hypothetical protein